MSFPPGFTYPAEKTTTACLVAAVIKHLVPTHRAVVQAGGCSGLWPLAFAMFFEHVYTFEPDPVNFRHLEANIASQPNITAFPYAVGDRRRQVGLTRTRPQPGLWRVEGEGEIPMVPIDEVMHDTAVDALVLDVEGSELRALRGAEQLIATHRPLLWFEFTHDTAAIERFLRAHEYLPPRRGIGADSYSLHITKEPHGREDSSTERHG